MELVEPDEPVRLFCGCSQRDYALREELFIHLASLKQQNVIDGWHDGLIGPGEDWKGEIERHLDRAQLIVLLISPDFISSDACSEMMRRAMARHHATTAHVIPVIVRPVDPVGAPFSQLKSLPSNDKPVKLWRNADEAWQDVARGIRHAVEAFRKKSALPMMQIKNDLDGVTAVVSGQPHVEFEITLRGTIEEVQERLEPIMAALTGRLSGRYVFIVKGIESGSVVLILEGPLEGFERIEALFEARQLTEVSGFEIEEVRRRPKRSTELLPAGEDVHLFMAVTRREAARGCRRRVQFVRRDDKGASERASIWVDVPADSSEGRSVKVPGQGQPSPVSGGPSGDLYVRLQIRPAASLAARGLHHPTALLASLSRGFQHPTAPLAERRIHPAALYVLVLMEVCERFGFYLALSVTALYLNERWKLSLGDSAALYGASLGLISLSPLVGGMLADRWLGQRPSVLVGAALLSAGYLILATDTRFALYAALALLVLGNGLFKPNLFNLAGNLYSPDDPRRDAAFGILYVGINVGALAGPIAASLIRNHYDWPATFAAGGSVVFFGLASSPPATVGWPRPIRNHATPRRSRGRCRRCTWVTTCRRQWSGSRSVP